MQGEFKQKTELFHRFFRKTTTAVAFNHFLISQKIACFVWLKYGSG
jgi:uncharacterized protein with PQ loop repeat